MSALEHFRAAARAALAYLHGRLSFDLWMLSRLEGDRLLVIEALDRSNRIGAGQVLPGARMPCSLMVSGAGPRVAPNVAEVPAYARLDVPRGVPFGAYVGAPAIRTDGGPVLTLAGFHSERVPAEVAAELPLVELQAGLLCALLDAEQRAAEASRRAELAEQEALTDELTGVASRRSWTRIMEREERRSRRYGRPASVVSIDLDDLKRVNDSIGHAGGDDLLRRAAEAIVSATRGNDVVARLGGDEFGVLALESDAEAAERLSARIVDALRRESIEASVGVATLEPAGSMEDTWRQADAAMYEEKRARAKGPPLEAPTGPPA